MEFMKPESDLPWNKNIFLFPVKDPVVGNHDSRQRIKLNNSLCSLQKSFP